jgi:integrase/recombinase XerD
MPTRRARDLRRQQSVSMPAHHLRLVRPHQQIRAGMNDLESMLNQWRTSMRAGGTSERTIGDRVGIVRLLAQRGSVNPVTATHGDIAAFLAAAQVRPSTRHAYYLRLRSWFRWLITEEIRDDNPTERITKPRVPRGRPRPIATGHLEVLLGSSMRARTRTMVLLAAYQGLRVHEIANLRGEQVDLLAMTLSVRGKGGVDAVLPLHPLIAQEAGRYPRRGWWFPTHVGNRGAGGGRTGPAAGGSGPVLARSVSTIISNAMGRAGVPGTAHSLRHWYGTELMRSSGNARVAQELLRHASLATTAVYTLVTMEDTRAALLALPGALEGSA